MLHLLNADRVAAGVAPLVLDQRLTSVAMSHSDDMARRHYFAHTASDGDNPFRRLDQGGITYAIAAENLGLVDGYPEQQAVAVLNARMMAEPLTENSHHGIILDPRFSHVGIGIYLAPGDTVYLTEDFTN